MMRRIGPLLPPLLLLALGAATPPLALAEDEVLTLDRLLANFGWDFATTEIKSQKLADGFYVLFGVGGNIAVSIGQSGTLIVDDQFPELVPKIDAAIRELGGKGVDFAINTHWHFDHAEGNLAYGPQGAWIVSQENSREMMGAPHIVNLVVAKYGQQAYPEEALPVITFDDRMSFHFNGEQIDLLHFGPAHTTGDTAVFFRGKNAIHMGDVFNNSGYPFIDADNGGSIDGMIAFCQAALAELSPGAMVIPGHGEVTDASRLEAYIAMLKTVRSRVSKMIAEGKTLEEVEAARPTADFDASYGDVAASLGFVDRVYTSLSVQAAR